MVRKISFLAILLISGGLVLSSCTKKEELSSKKEILSFIFEASKNATELDENVLGDINGTDVIIEVPFGTDVSNLIGAVELSPRATISPALEAIRDYSSPLTFTVTAEDGTTKQFIVTVGIEPAPYIGSWKGGPIDFGWGLMNVELVITEDAHITMELLDLLSGETHSRSIKGTINPQSKVGREIPMAQTHRWISDTWTEESVQRTIMYSFTFPTKMRYYYCLTYPKDVWCFLIDLTRK